MFRARGFDGSVFELLVREGCGFCCDAFGLSKVGKMRWWEYLRGLG